MNTAVNRECWNVRVGKDAFETVVSCYADIHMYREKERERETWAVRPLTAKIRLRSLSGSMRFVASKLTHK
jgi:hypothetical protein